MRRREFVGVLAGAAFWFRPARAQHKIWRVGWLSPGIRVPHLFDAFRRQLRDHGYIEGVNLIIDQRLAEGHDQRLPELAKEIVALRPDVIITVASSATAAVKRATSTIPIIMLSVSDPIALGFVQNFAHPGGNVTGLVNMFGDTMGKTIDVFHSLLSDAKNIAVLLSSNPTHPRQYDFAKTALEAVGLSAVPILAATPADLPRAFHQIADHACDALFVVADLMRPDIVRLAAEAGIPAMYQYREFVDAGGLASYGASNSAMHKKAADYADRILKGASPADLPVEQPTTFEFVINLKTAKALGLTVPPSLLARADEVIE
jgi:putative tryptophan/tyrosine transport system substrate-binding protein